MNKAINLINNINIKSQIRKIIKFKKTENLNKSLFLNLYLKKIEKLM